MAKQYNEYEFIGDLVEISVKETNGELKGVVIIDKDIFNKIRKYDISINTGGVIATNDKEIILLHRLITDAKEGSRVIYANKNKFDLRLENLKKKEKAVVIKKVKKISKDTTNTININNNIMIPNKNNTDSFAREYNSLWDNGEGMNFSQALECLKNGQKISRGIWSGYWTLEILEGLTRPVIVATLKDTCSRVPASPYQEDLLATDWKIIK